ncbi:MAG: 4Fe-4S binding protein [Verrucomicrobia bacterium]|nr:4Fe-4S binding protein [Verrucomicrobiota bacterium]
MTHALKSSIAALAFILSGIGLYLCKSVPIFPKDLWLAAAVVGVLTGVLVGVSGFNDRRRSPALIRLDHFLPFMRKKWQIQGRPNAIVRIARRILPERFFFSPTTGMEGVLRRILRRIGVPTLSSPIRRVLQSVCFALFLWSFFHICWPYSAKPASDGVVLSGLRFIEIEQESGRLTFSIQSQGTQSPVEGELWHLSDAAQDSSEKGSVGRFQIAAIEGSRLSLKSDGDLKAEQLDTILLGSGSWELHETEPGRWPSHYADELSSKEVFPAEAFLIIDPLVSLSTAIAARSWVWSLVSAGVILIVCVLIPRGFCGYVCPLGTLIDLFDWSVGSRWKRFRVSGEGWWVHIKYYLLAGILVAALFGVLASGYFAAIPVITRGMLFLGEPLQSGLARGLHLVPRMNAGHWVSITMFGGVLLLGFLRPRFWCKYVCPSGALFSLSNVFRMTERKVEASCIHCNKCVTVCPFDAIKPDFTTRVTDCTLCQTCGGVCPTHSIKFVERWNRFDLKQFNLPPTGETLLGRRNFMGLLGGSAAAVAGGASVAAVSRLFGAGLDDPNRPRPVRPPGSVPEREFLQLCIRCGECFKACPNNVLQPLGFQQGLEGLWTPRVDANWAGCESSCNACGQVCPTGAIRALPLVEKKAARMGLAVVNQNTCLPFAEREACQLCVDECAAAGYHAIEFTTVGTEIDTAGNPIQDSGYLAPVVLLDKCVGCGLCQTRCFGINAEQKGLLTESAIIIEAGPGKEDRILNGSYVALHNSNFDDNAVSSPIRVLDTERKHDPFDVSR